MPRFNASRLRFQSSQTDFECVQKTCAVYAAVPAEQTYRAESGRQAIHDGYKGLALGVAGTLTLLSCPAVLAGLILHAEQHCRQKQCDDYKKATTWITDDMQVSNANHCHGHCIHTKGYALFLQHASLPVDAIQHSLT